MSTISIRSHGRTMQRIVLVMAAFFGAIAPRGAPAQSPPHAAPNAAEAAKLVHEAFLKTKSAETIQQYTEIIDLCEQGRAGMPDQATADYADKLASWAYNRRGEALADQAVEAADAGRQEESQELDAKALADFEAAVKLDRTRWRAFHNRGVSLALVGKYPEAIADFDQTIKLKADYANAWFNRGEIHYQIGKFDEAVRDYDEAIRLKPKDAGAYDGRGHAYCRLGRYEKAMADYDRAVELDPQDAEALADRADAHAELGRWREAAEDYRAAIERDKTFARAYQGAAWLMATCPDEKFRKAEMGVAAAKKAIELGGADDYRCLDTLAAAQANAGRYDEAAAAMEKAIQLAPEDVAQRLHNRLVLYREGRPYRSVARTESPSGEKLR